MHIYKKFDIIVIPFPYTDKTATKNRPALILSDHHFNCLTEHCIIAMITSSSGESWPYDMNITNLETTALLKPSIVRLKLFTLDQRLIKTTIGKLSDIDQKQLLTILGQLFQDL